MDLNKIGGIATKGITLNEKKGNKPPRICEINNGIMNSVGLQNPGIHGFIKNELAFMRQFETKIIVNIAGSSIEEYCQIAEILADQDIDGIELNVSCPNVKEGCIAFGNTANGIYEVTAAVRSRTNKPLIVKLTPNVTDIVEIAFGAEAAGADCLSMINTITGMAIDIKTKKPRLSNITGGISGPTIKPIAVRMVYEAAKAVKIPVIGMGGIMSGEDAIEFFLAGAKAVMVGTANLIRPDACLIIAKEIEMYLIENNYKSIEEIIGKVEV
jgi:dihydroorotate dehydrogenase (NAD+) catalytic subunit